MLRKPNLFVIGARKSGTSSLYKCLYTHPEIYLPSVKETKHFSAQEEWSKGNGQYLKLYSKASNEVYLGDVSPSYTGLPWCEGIAERIYNFNSSAKIIYILRDPLERMLSHYKHYLDRGEETLVLSEEIKEKCEYLMLSNYAYQLKPYHDLFGSDAIYVDTLEAMKKSPESFYKSLFKWLGVDSSFVPPNSRKRFHRSGAIVQQWDNSSMVVKIARGIKRSTIINRLTPRKIQELIVKYLPKKNDPLFSPDSFQKEVNKVKKDYQPVLARWVKDLETITGRTYEAWPSAMIKPTDHVGLGSLCIDEKLPQCFR